MLAYWFINTKWKYFFNVGSTLSSNIHCNVDPLYYVEANPNSIVTPYLTVGDIVSVISSLSNSSTGYDKMLASILKKCIDKYITPIIYLVKLSIRQKSFPSKNKLAKIIPVFKFRSQQLINSYQPISVRPLFAKIYKQSWQNSWSIF